ncbi:MAG: hypothetical protein L3J05_02830, partial [Robiginitomaculum sp.]|nr:hypothetical protein [Robiginitomaculum sp.]
MTDDPGNEELLSAKKWLQLIFAIVVRLVFLCIGIVVLLYAIKNNEAIGIIFTSVWNLLVVW